MAKDEELVSRFVERAGVESEAVKPACPRKGSEAAFQRALELSDRVLRKNKISII